MKNLYLIMLLLVTVPCWAQDILCPRTTTCRPTTTTTECITTTIEPTTSIVVTTSVLPTTTTSLEEVTTSILTTSVVSTSTIYEETSSSTTVPVETTTSFPYLPTTTIYNPPPPVTTTVAKTTSIKPTTTTTFLTPLPLTTTTTCPLPPTTTTTCIDLACIEGTTWEYRWLGYLAAIFTFDNGIIIQAPWVNIFHKYMGKYDCDSATIHKTGILFNGWLLSCFDNETGTGNAVKIGGWIIFYNVDGELHYLPIPVVAFFKLERIEKEEYCR